MKLNPSETKRIEALRNKATLNAKEEQELDSLEAKLNDNSTSHDVVNPAPTAQVVGIAEMKLRDNDPDKPVMIRLVESVGGTDILLLSAKQADSLASSINIYAKGVDAWRQMKTLVGNRRSEVELSVQLQKKGSSFVDRNGVVIVRDTDGASVLPQTIILPMSIQQDMDTQAVKTVVKSWTSSARFLPQPQGVGVGAEE